MDKKKWSLTVCHQTVCSSAPYACPFSRLFSSICEDFSSQNNYTIFILFLQYFPSMFFSFLKKYNLKRMIMAFNTLQLEE